MNAASLGEPRVLGVLVGVHRAAEDHDRVPVRRGRRRLRLRSPRPTGRGGRPARPTTRSNSPPPPVAAGSWTTERTRTRPTASRRSEQRQLGRRRLDAAGRRDARLVEQPTEDLRAPRGEVVAVVVEERVDLLGLARRAARAARPTPRAPPPSRASRSGRPRCSARGCSRSARCARGTGRTPPGASPRRRAARRSRRGSAGCRARRRRARSPRGTRACRPLGLLHPRAVPELDSGTSGASRSGRPGELGLRRRGLGEPRVVLEEDAAELPGQLERLERGPEEPERVVGRLALVPGHRRRRLDVEREPVRGPPAQRSVTAGSGSA